VIRRQAAEGGRRSRLQLEHFAWRFGCCAWLVRGRPSHTGNTSNDGRGVCPAGFLLLEVVAAADHAPSYRDQLI
jgi:hypothetical protein